MMSAFRVSRTKLANAPTAGNLKKMCSAKSRLEEDEDDKKESVVKTREYDEYNAKRVAKPNIPSGSSKPHELHRTFTNPNVNVVDIKFAMPGREPRPNEVQPKVATKV